MWTSYVEWLDCGAILPYGHEVRLPQNAPMQLLRLRRPAGHFPDPATPDLVLQLVVRTSGHAYVDVGVSRGYIRARVGLLGIAPAGIACNYELSDPFELLGLTLPFARVKPVMDEMSGGVLADLAPIHRHEMPHDAVLASLMTRLWAEAAEGNLMGPLYAEDAAVAIASRLVRLALRAHGAPAMKHEDTHPLHGARLARVLALIEDVLDGELHQADLAAAAGLSPWHFARAFKAATGLAPHRFVLLRRLARVQWLLRTTGLTLAEVAAACGFADHAHLSAVFRREVGRPPSVWRREQRTR